MSERMREVLATQRDELLADNAALAARLAAVEQELTQARVEASRIVKAISTERDEAQQALERLAYAPVDAYESAFAAARTYLRKHGLPVARPEQT